MSLTIPCMVLYGGAKTEQHLFIGISDMFWTGRQHKEDASRSYDQVKPSQVKCN